jgi:hypothetical protein
MGPGMRGVGKKLWVRECDELVKTIMGPGM